MRELVSLERFRSALLGDAGIAWDLSLVLSDAASEKAVSGHGMRFLLNGIAGYLLGFDSEAQTLVSKACSWLQWAEDHGERPAHYFEYGTEALRCYYLSLGHWLLGDSSSRALLDRSMQLDQRYFQSTGLTKLTVELALPAYLEAHRFERALELFRSAKGLREPKSSMNVVSPASMTFVIATAAINGARYEKPLHAFLRRNVKRWLDAGLLVDVAQWMKITHFDLLRDETDPVRALCRSLRYASDEMTPN